MSPIELLQEAEVALLVYDLEGAGALNAATRLLGFGAFHVSIEVYGLEWSYGSTAQGTGVFSVPSGQSFQWTLRERLPLGRTPSTLVQVDAMLEELRPLWPGAQYHALRRNCVHFSTELASRLRVRSVPTWVNLLAGTCDQLVTSLELIAGPFALPKSSRSAKRLSISSGSTAELQEDDLAAIEKIGQLCMQENLKLAPQATIITSTEPLWV